MSTFILVILLCALACPLAMGVMMWLMGRGMGHGRDSSSKSSRKEGPMGDEPPAAPRRASKISYVLQSATVIFVGALLGLLVYRLVVSERGGALVAAVREGKRPAAPQFELKVIWPRTDTWPGRFARLADAGRLSTSDLRGLPVVMNFWASWCIPCKHEAPRLAASARRHRGKVLFLGVDVQDFTSDARKFLGRHHVNYPSVRDGTPSTYDKYGLTGVPETYYMDARGRLVAHSLGEVSTRELEAEVAKIEGEG